MNTMSTGNEEYTDYSCSTPMERLAQDVETVLRKWHLARSDRHISFARPPPQIMSRSQSDKGLGSPGPLDANNRKTAARSMSQSRSMILDLGSSDDTNHMMLPELETPTRKTAIRKQSSSEPPPPQQENQDVKNIRQEQIDWTLSLVDGRRVTLALNLDLWDGPTMDDDDMGQDLPLSLRRLPLQQMPADLFDNLSTVFGIGQHITLSLKKGRNSAEDTDTVIKTLGASILRRHDDDLAPWVVSSSLSGMLQTALQCALSNIQCNLPAFGIWGSYAPEAPPALGKTTGTAKLVKSSFRNNAPLLPYWLQDCVGSLPTGRRPLFRSTNHLNRTYIPPILKSSMMQDDNRPQFWMSVMPFNDSSSGRLTVWGELLLRHSSTPTVVLCGAKHLYAWRKPQTKLPRTSLLLRRAPAHTWRQPITIASAGIHEYEYESSVEAYQIQCRNYVMSLFEQFSGATVTNPLWGPVDDPVEAVNVIVTWDPQRGSGGNTNKKSSGPGGLLTMPLKIRSEQGMSKEDLTEMEEAIERSILDPLNPSAFEISTVFDSNTSLVNLGASQRLLLAAMIRTSVLPSNTMIYQLADEVEMDAFSNPEIDHATENLLNRSGVGPMTRELVNAIDWTTLSDEMIEGWEAERIVQKVMDGTLSHGFASPPDKVFVDPEGSAAAGLFKSLPKSAPPGRLLSVLFVHMSRLRSPASMALVWSYFVMDLQKRFYSRTSLPNMPYVPGIDPSPSMIEEKHCFSMSALRSKVENTAYVHCSEPQPDDMHCLIGQKLQVFNIAIESLVATDMYNSTKMDRSFEHDDEAVHDEKVVFSNLPARQDSRGEDQHEIRDDRSGMSGFEFHDARSVGSHAMTAERYIFDEGLDTSNAHDVPRDGARCPVFGATLVASGDQVYAPYLRRPYPWTDDVLLERKGMLSKTARSSSVVERLDVAHRFVTSKLLSDMQAFKAANPGAIFQDFVNWYGNPAKALDGFDDDAEIDDEYSVRIQNSTRAFWAEIWQGAEPLPAIEQPALFDLTSTVELVLDHLETVHPASLLNQVMAVNLSMSYFTMIATAGQAILVPTMSATLLVLREKIEHALGVLARDATNGTCAVTPTSPELFPRHVSLQSIRACEDACNAISETEALLSKVTSLLHKFPQQVDFIEHILNHRSGDILAMKHREGRKAVLGVIQQQQQQNSGSLPNPSRRSYVLRNTDEERPCQMCVRYGEDGSFQDTRDGGLLIAITKTQSTAIKVEI